MTANRVLLIEDNSESLELMIYLLTAFEFEALSAENGRAGLAMALRSPPDLIVCDIQLPELDGYAVAKALKENTRTARIPLVAVTAYAMVGDRDRILAAGFDGYIAKPIDPEQFVPALRGYLARSTG